MYIDELSETPDIDFVLACRDGDVDAFAALYRRHAPTVLRYAWSRLGDRSLAEEVLQDTFTTAWAKRRSASIADLSLLPWLLAICRNYVRNQIRRSARSRTTPLDPRNDGSGEPRLPSRVDRGRDRRTQPDGSPDRGALSHRRVQLPRRG